MSIEICKLCDQESTPWHYVHGHICDSCYHYGRQGLVMNEWISVKDELPKLLEKGCEPVLIASYCNERKIYHISAAVFQRGHFYNPAYNEHIPIDDPYWSITHWMPFPSTPELP